MSFFEDDMNTDATSMSEEAISGEGEAPSTDAPATPETTEAPAEGDTPSEGSAM